MKILAIDASLKHSGFAYIKDTPVFYTFSPSENELWEIFQHLFDLCIQEKFDYCIKEGIAFGAPGWSVNKLNEVGGIIKAVLQANNIPLLEAYPCTLKRIVTGNGRASKEEVMQAVCDKYQVVVEDNNQSDALGLLIVAEQYLIACQAQSIQPGSIKIGQLLGTKLTKRNIELKTQKRKDCISLERRKEIAQKTADSITPERRKEIGAKISATKQRNKESKLNLSNRVKNTSNTDIIT